MINWYTVTVEMQRRQDEVASAANHHYSKHIMRQPKDGRKAAAHIMTGHIMAEVLILAGNWLVHMGCRLQAPYTKLAIATRKGMQQDHIMAPQKAPCTS